MSTLHARRNPSIIALCAGAPGSGKDTLFDLLKASGLKVVNVKFAEELTKELHQCFQHWTWTDFLEVRNHPEDKNKQKHSLAIEEVFDRGYREWLIAQGHDAWEPRSMRWHLIEYGTNYVRKHLGKEDHWLNLGMTEVAYQHRLGNHVVVTDCRFPNELAELKRVGAKVFYLQADWADPSVGGIADGLIKPSDCDHILTNEWGSPRKLLEKFNAALSV